MLRKHFDNEIIELSNNLEDIWISIIKKYAGKRVQLNLTAVSVHYQHG